MEDDLARRLAHFERSHFPRYREEYERLAREGQSPRTLFIGCSDSRVIPNLITGMRPGELFVVRNVGNLVPPYDTPGSDHGTVAAVEYAVLRLGVRDIVVCGHSHCGAMRALYDDAKADVPNLNQWLDLAREAVLPVTVSEEALRRTEQRSVVLQLERLAAYPMVARGLGQGTLFLHGWHYVIEDGRILVLDIESGEFVPTDVELADEQPPGGSPASASR
jgi:carbonic anhydrase